MMRASHKQPGFLAAMVHRIAGETLGIVGLGHVGRQVAPRARGLGMQVQATDPFLDPAIADDLGVRLVPLDELLATSDFVSIHAPLYRDTHHLINAERLARFKPGAYLINCARGSLVDTPALVEALERGRLAGAGLDVFDPEPLPPDSPLLKMENVVVSPHTAGVTNDARRNMAKIAAEQLRNTLAGERPERLINPEAWPRYTERFAKALG